MLRYILGILFVLTALSPIISTQVFADSFVVTLDNVQPELGDTLLVSGEIIELGMPIIAMSVYDPDGQILSAYNLEISSNSFSKSLSLESPFYEKTGEYTIKFVYGQITQNYFFEIQSTEPVVVESEVIIESENTPEILLLYTEKQQYTDSEIIKISGLVSSLNSPTVLIGIHDPFGMPAGFYFGNVNSDLEFSTSFLVKDGVNFRTEGTYSIKAHYAESEAVSFFEYSKVSQEIIPDVETTEDTVDVNDDETIDENISSDEIVSDTNDSSDEEKIDEAVDETIDDEINETLENESTPDDSIIPNTVDDTEEKNIPKIIDDESNLETVSPNIEIKNQNNLSVEDIELGKILNQINLECDSSNFVDMISYYDGMGPALYRLCDFDSSFTFFKESLNTDPNDVEILVNTGSAIGKLGDFSKAIFYYDLALEIDSTFLPAKNNKANALANLGHLDDAIILYETILDENPNSITTQKNLETANFLIDDLPVENIISNEPVIEKTLTVNNEKQKQMNFFEQINSVFSSFGNFFNFLN
jgi:tetratricopeptide (TPR) repeat protein